jgi:hypothetical protein
MWVVLNPQVLYPVVEKRLFFYYLASLVEAILNQDGLRYEVMNNTIPEPVAMEPIIRVR